MNRRLMLVAIFICILILFAYRKCEPIDQMIRCDTCQTHCTSENAFWAFLILSLPTILALQYLVDNPQNRQTRYVYNSPIIINNRN